jgi:hypothetical protein
MNEQLILRNNIEVWVSTQGKLAQGRRLSLHESMLIEQGTIPLNCPVVEKMDILPR